MERRDGVMNGAMTEDESCASDMFNLYNRAPKWAAVSGKPDGISEDPAITAASRFGVCC